MKQDAGIVLRNIRNWVVKRGSSATTCAGGVHLKKNRLVILAPLTLRSVALKLETRYAGCGCVSLIFCVRLIAGAADSNG